MILYENTAVLPIYTHLPHIPTHPHTQRRVVREEVNWYLKEVEADIETIEELAEKNVLVEKVIDCQVQHVSQYVTIYVTISTICSGS